VFQQRALGRRVAEPLAASVWINVHPDARGDVLLYTNVLYADGGREDPHSSVAADPSGGGTWQRLSVSVTPDPDRVVDFVGVYLLTDAFSGEVWADDFELVGGESLGTSTGAATDAGSELRRSPLFGGGPRAGEDSTLDNEYLLVAARFGLVGLAAYLALWAATALMGRRGARRGNPLAAAVVGMVAGLLLFNLVAGSLYQLQLMAVFWPVAGVLLAAPEVSGVRSQVSGNAMSHLTPDP
jgi:hypothetical protein